MKPPFGSPEIWDPDLSQASHRALPTHSCFMMVSEWLWSGQRKLIRAQMSL